MKRTGHYQERAPARFRFALRAVSATVLLSGCADWSYDRIRLGAEREHYEKAFPDADTRRTDIGVCYLGKDDFGRTDAVFLLLTADRRIAGKFMATFVHRDYGLRVDTGYRLCGEVDPRLARFTGTGPIDTLRALITDLTTAGGERMVREAHAWVAAGLVRILQSWPNASDTVPSTAPIIDTLERVPGGGEATIRVGEDGILHVGYRQGASP